MLSTVYVVVVCLSLWYCIKTAKCRITQIMPHDSLVTLVFCHQSSWQNSNGFTHYGGDKCRWGGLKIATFNEKRVITRKWYKIDAYEPRLLTDGSCVAPAATYHVQLVPRARTNPTHPCGCVGWDHGFDLRGSISK